MYVDIWYINSYILSNNELTTTLTDDIDIARLAIHGCNTTPTDTNAPAARGKPMALYMIAHKKLILILLTVRRDNCIAASTS